MAKNQSQVCRCWSNKPYQQCCQKYHQGVLAENALVLMRSRFSAYALGLADYIIETTHIQSPYFVNDKKKWLYQIYTFSREVNFNQLEILEVKYLEFEAFVTFVAHLSKQKKDLTFTEKSRFLKQDLAWKYMEGKIATGALSLEQMKSF